MHPRERACRRLRTPPLTLAALAALSAFPAFPAFSAGPAAAGQAEPTLAAVFDAAWRQQPLAQALPARRDAAQAQRLAAAAWTPEPAALEASHKTDRLTRNEGAREIEVGLAVPLWLPGQRQRSLALADAQAVALESRTEAARLQLAATVREAWWNGQRARLEVDIARSQLANARDLAGDVARRARAGELARADQHQAEASVAAAEADLALAQAAATAALQALKALGGASIQGAGAVAALPEASTASEPEPTPGEAPTHPALAELQDLVTVAERSAALAATQSRANPELTLSGARERGGVGERYGQTLTLALRIPFGDGPRHDSRLASARADALEAQAQLALDRARLQAEREAATARVDAARASLAAALRRAALAVQTRGFFEKSFRLGETDLPTRLRVENDATASERQAARSRVELAAAISAWRQALGLLPR